MRKSETYRNEIKSYIVRTGMTMTEVVDYLSDEYGWSRSVPNLSGKLKRGSLRYGEAVELADALGYDIVWEKRKSWDLYVEFWKTQSYNKKKKIKGVVLCRILLATSVIWKRCNISLKQMAFWKQSRVT